MSTKPYLDRLKEAVPQQGSSTANLDISRDPMVVQFAQHEVDAILKDIDLKVLVERLANKYNLSREKARKAVISVLRSMLTL